MKTQIKKLSRHQAQFTLYLTDDEVDAANLLASNPDIGFRQWMTNLIHEAIRLGWKPCDDRGIALGRLHWVRRTGPKFLSGVQWRLDVTHNRLASLAGVGLVVVSKFVRGKPISAASRRRLDAAIERYSIKVRPA